MKRMSLAIGVLFLIGWAAVAANAAAAESPVMRGPLRRHPTNPRYFTDDSGRAILLTGAHTWNNLVDMGPSDPPPQFDYDKYLDWLSAYPHNFFRLWAWELTEWDVPQYREKGASVLYVAPHPWKRVGPGKALDGKPKFDLKQFDDEYFARLRDRVQKARDRGIYVGVMLFEGWGVQFAPNGWSRHPFNAENNVNSINGNLDGDGKGIEIHTGRSREVTEIQRAYVRKVIDTVNEFDNVLYEISNENHPPSTEWQYDMIRYIKGQEKAKPKQHPVGMTFQYKAGSNKTLFDSPADWISPNPDGGYRDNPPAADGSKVILSDTDHLWGLGGNVGWYWKSLTRGMNPILMDFYDRKVLSKGGGKAGDKLDIEPIRRTIGHALRLSCRVDLATLTPQSELASTKYCLANPGKEYLVYLPDGGDVTLDLSAAQATFTVEWLNPHSGETTAGDAVAGGANLALKVPFAGDAVVHVKAK